MSPKQILIDLLNGAIIQLGKRVSPSLAWRLAEPIAAKFKLDRRLNKRKLRENLHRYFPNRDADWVESTAVGLQVNSYRAQTFDKYFLPRLSDDETEALFDVENQHYVDDAAAAGRGIIIAMMHIGRFWAVGLWFSRKGYKISAFQRARGQLPNPEELLSAGSHNASDPASAIKAVRQLKDGGVLVILVDSARTMSPVVLDFLGKATLVPDSAVRLARMGDAVVIPTVARVHPEDPDRILLTFEARIDPRDLPADEPVETTVRRVLEPLEARIREAPEQWYGFQSAHKRLAEQSAPDA